MTDNPYKNLPDKAFWRRAVSSLESSQVDPIGLFDIRITTDMKVATAGSCFAQHIARHLQTSGFNYYVEEKGHSLISKTIRNKRNYRIFSALYGNIYSTD